MLIACFVFLLEHELSRELKEIIDGVEVTDLLYPNTLGSYIIQALSNARRNDEGSGAKDLDAFKQLFDAPIEGDGKYKDNTPTYE